MCDLKYKKQFYNLKKVKLAICKQQLYDESFGGLTINFFTSSVNFIT